ncbi:DoxX family protein, partial [Sphingobacterium hungaricum]
MNTKTKNIIGWVLAGLVAFVLIASGVQKLIGSPEMVEQSAKMGGLATLRILGTLELVIAVLYLIPRTGVLGTLLAVAYMGGAMATHLVGGMPILIPTIIQILIWITSAIRFPELTTRLVGS